MYFTFILYFTLGLWVKVTILYYLYTILPFFFFYVIWYYLLCQRSIFVMLFVQNNASFKLKKGFFSSRVTKDSFLSLGFRGSRRVSEKVDVLSRQRSSTVKSLSLKWEFFLLKSDKDQQKCVKVTKDLGQQETERERGKWASPLFPDSRELLWDDVLQKIEAKKENLRERNILRYGRKDTPESRV